MKHLLLSLTLIISANAWADERKDTRTEAECDQGPDIWDEEKQECILVGAPFAFEVFPKDMEKEESSSFIQSVILFLPKQEGETRKREDVLMIVEHDGIECRHHGRVTFLVTRNKDKKITKIESDAELNSPNTFCASKEDFNICIAKPNGWDLSAIEDEEVCFYG
jgi:hypothetical protein